MSNKYSKARMAMLNFQELIGPNKHTSIEAWQEFAIGMFDIATNKIEEAENENRRAVAAGSLEPKAICADDLNEVLTAEIDREIDLTSLSTQQLLQFTDILIQMARGMILDEKGYKLNAWCALLMGPVTQALENRLPLLLQASHANLTGFNYEIMQVMCDIKEIAELLNKRPENYSNIYAQYVAEYHRDLEKHFKNPGLSMQLFVQAKRELAAVRMLDQAAQVASQKKIRAQTLFSEVIKKGRFQDVERILNGKFQEQFTMDALEDKFNLPIGSSIDDYCIFPGIKLRDLLERGESANPDATIREIISTYVQSNPDSTHALLNANITLDRTTLGSVCEMCQLEGEGSYVDQLFQKALGYVDQPTDLSSELRLLTDLHSNIAPAVKNITIVENQLAALFQNHQDLSSCIKVYMDEQKRTMLFLAKNGEITQYVQPFNLVAAIGGTIAKYPGMAERLKSFDELRGIVLLAERLQTLASECPKKALKIHQALTQILASKPHMTFDNLVEEMRTNKDKNNDFGQLKRAMGKHQNFFWKIVNYFYTVNTETLRLFKEQIQDMKRSANVTGVEETPGQTRSSFGDGPKV
ncbi:MAG: hypothetical protein NTU48_01805 [Legionellales bacterium]|nr:hypothetical protein [Legionellales bacterium]